MSSDPIVEVRVKIERAEKHIGDFYDEANAWHRTDPYVFLPEIDPKTGDQITKVTVKEQIPLRFSAIAGDAIHSLRAALNVLWAIVMQCGRDRKCDFPIFESREKFEAARSREIKTMRKAAMSVLHTIKPYRGGNDTLWALHILDIIDKHHTLLIVANRLAYTHVSFRPDHPIMAGDGFIVGDPTGPALIPLDDGAIVFRLPANLLEMVNKDPQFAVIEAFGDPGPFQGQPVVESLLQTSQFVRNISEQFARLL